MITLAEFPFAINYGSIYSRDENIENMKIVTQVIVIVFIVSYKPPTADGV